MDHCLGCGIPFEPLPEIEDDIYYCQQCAAYRQLWRATRAFKSAIEPLLPTLTPIRPVNYD